MTPAMTPRIRRWGPSAAIISVTGVRPAIAFCVFLFYFDVIFFGVLLFVPTSLGFSPLFPSIIGDYIEYRKYFTCLAILQVLVATSRGPSPGRPHSVPGSRS
jgi:hypothetical protein